MAAVLGLDLSLTATGLAEVRDGKVVGTTRVRSSGSKDATLKQRQERLHGIGQDIAEWVSEEPSDLIVIESPSYGSKFGSPHDRSGLWWLVVNHLSLLGHEIATVAPMSRAKYGTGNGAARKADVLEAVRLRFPEEHAAGMIPDDNVADAILLASMGARILGDPVEGDLPPKCLEALEKVAMP